MSVYVFRFISLLEDRFHSLPLSSIPSSASSSSQPLYHSIQQFQFQQQFYSLSYTLYPNCNTAANTISTNTSSTPLLSTHTLSQKLDFFHSPHLLHPICIQFGCTAFIILSEVEDEQSQRIKCLNSNEAMQLLSALTIAANTCQWSVQSAIYAQLFSTQLIDLISFNCLMSFILDMFIICQ